MDQQEYARTSAAFLRFADEEARDRSALYDELARGAASDPLVITFLLHADASEGEASAKSFIRGHTPPLWDTLRLVPVQIRPQGE